MPNPKEVVATSAETNTEMNTVTNTVTNTAFILRFTWDSAAQKWRILLKPVDGGAPRVFGDLESAFLHLAQLYTHSE